MSKNTKLKKAKTATHMMTKLLFFLAVSAGLFSRPALADIVNVTGPITANTNWVATNTYILNGPVYVLAPTALNIEAGTIIQGQTNATAATIAYLAICRGAKIFANGTANRPIIFTSVLDDVFDPFDLSPYQRGLWGGVILFGNARLNTASDAAGNAASPKYDVYEGLADTQINGQFVNRFGGNDDDDSCGVFRYVSIRHGGKVLESNKEINGLSLGAVGRGTTIEFVEAYAIADDGFEFFGGTVNCKYLVSAFNDDDAFDTDQGYSGKLQFLFGLQVNRSEAGIDQSKRDKGFELNGEPNGIAVGASPKMLMQVYNATSIGAGAGSGGSANNTFTIREIASPKFYNCIFTDYAQRGISIGDNCTNDLNAGNLDLRDNIWWGFTGGADPNSATNLNILNAAILFSDAARNNTIVDPLLRGISRTNNGGLDPRPLPGSPALTSVRTAPNDGFFTPVCFKGAFDTNDLWLSGWTALSQYGIVKPRGGLTNNVSGTITGVTNWTRDTTYVLNGPVYVLNNAVLNIEAGTVIKGQTNATPATIAFLTICQGGKIYANGTANSPIIMTSILDDVDDPLDLPIYQRGLWGGLVVFGNARLNTASDAAGNVASPKYDVYEGLSDTVIGGQHVHRFGGSNDDDNSGVIRYVSIRHGGKVLESNKEINGLSLGAVGRGTTIEFVEAYAIADDGFEWFGGTVNARYLVSAFNDDDTFDADQGYSGKLQFLFSIQESGARDKGWELNGEPNGIAVGSSPKMLMQVYNATTIGAGAGSGGSANNTFTIREIASPQFYNCIFTDYAQRGISIGDNCTNDLNAGNLDLRDNLWWGFTGGVNPNSATNLNILNAAILFSDAARNNAITDPLLGGISRVFGNGLDPRPQAGSPALVATRTPPTDGFYVPVAYKGAFGANNWAADWTALSEYGILSGAGARVPMETLIEPQFTQVAVSAAGSQFVLSFATSSGFNYQVQTSTNLSTWTNIGGLINGSGAVKSYSDPGLVSDPNRFFRVRALIP